MKVIKPPQSLARHKGQSIFLAGSIELDTAEQWQKKVEKYFENTEYVLFNPRRDNWDNSWEKSVECPQFYQQVDWENRALSIADHIIMYFDPNTKSPISLLELGTYAGTGKMRVCCPKDFWRRGNVEYHCMANNIPFYETLDEMLNGAFGPKTNKIGFGYGTN